MASTHRRLLSIRLGLAAGLIAAACAGCSVQKRPTPEADPEPEKAAPKAAGVGFGWEAGDRFEVVYAAERKGNRIELRTAATVSAQGGGALRVHFEPIRIADRDKKAMAAGKSHAYLDVWPDLVVNGATGALEAIEADLAPAAKEAVQHRWETWTALVGDDLPAGEKRSAKTEVEVGEGLLVPVIIEESHVIDPAVGHRWVMTRTYQGDQTRKLWVAMLAEVGAPRKDIDAVVSATREEKLTVITEPKTSRHMRVVSSSNFTVTSKGGRAERIDVHAETDDFAFTWQ